MFSLIGGIIALGLLIVVHEAGHYFVARWCKMRVDRFSIGFGPPILKWRRGETDFTLGPIPFGGFVQIRGMTVAEEVDPDDERAYPNRPTWQRFATIFAGPATNYLFAIVLAVVFFAINGKTDRAWYGIGEIKEGWPAAGVLEPGDKIVGLDGKPYYAVGPDGAEYDTLSEVLAKSDGRPLALTVEREGKQIDLAVPTRRDDAAGGLFADVPEALKPYRLGVVLSFHDQRADMSIPEAMAAAVTFPITQTKLIATNLFEIVTGKVKPDLRGPVGITKMIKDQFEISLTRVLELLMLLNVALGLFNLLPLPALDGGRLVFLGYEMATRRRANPKVEAAVHMVGMMALLLLMVLVTYKDIARLFS